MRKTRKKITSYDDMIVNYYGNMHHHKLHHRKQHQHNGHRHDKAVVENKNGAQQVVLSKSFDNGEILQQDVDNNPARGFEEYVLQSSLPTFEEYVVMGDDSLSVTSSVPTQIDIPGIPHINLPDEYKMNILDPLGMPDNRASDLPYDLPEMSERNDPFAMSSSADIPLAEEITDTKKSKLSEDDLFSDMQEILSGAKVFDPLTKRTISKDKLAKQASTDSPQPQRQQPQAQSSPDDIQLPASGEHAIFDRIAQSMQYANAYDLGTYELENRFSDFDRISDHKEKESLEKNKPAAKKEPDPEIKAGHAEFIQDLDSIKKQQKEKEALETEKEKKPVQDTTIETKTGTI